MHWTDRRTRFRALLAGERCIHPGSVFDPISARIAEDLGFEIGMFAGSVASMTVLGAPDLIVLTLSEFAGQAYRINRAGGLPLMVDADHGYGNALNARRTVEELETAGVCGLSLEDTDLPTPYGTTAPRLISIDEGVAKMKAALPELSPSVIPNGTYKQMAEDQKTVGLFNFAIANKAVPDSLAYAIVKAVHENHEAMVKGHSAASETIPQNVAKNTFLPFHPGAAKYYREKGIAIPANLVG